MNSFNIFRRNIFIIILIPIINLSCSRSFLEVAPKGKLIAQKTNDYYFLLNSINWISTAPDAYMGDDVCAVDEYFVSAPAHFQRAFRYEEHIYLAGETPSTLTGTRFSMLYMLNKVINEVMESTEGTEQQKKEILAEAKVHRAWEHLVLINWFAPPYNAATATTDPGFPIITTADITESFNTKATVQEMYDFIIKDLTEAIPDLNPRIRHYNRASKPAGEAILARVYWLMGRYAEALPLLNNAFNGLVNKDILIQLNDYNVTTLPGGLQAVSGFQPRGLVYALGDPECVMVKTLLTSAHASSGSDIFVNPTTAALYDPEDIRFSKFLVKRTIRAATPLLPNGVYQKVGFTRSTFGAVALPDMYLMRAECRARGGDLSGAISDLETLRAARMPTHKVAVPTGLSKDDLIRYVIDERRREFAGLGHRWQDMRRLKNDPLFSGSINLTHTLYDMSGGVIDTYTLSGDKMYYQIPPAYLDANPGLGK